MPKRIMIFGRPGSGKSTLAYELSSLTGLTLHHVDKIYFVDNWVKQEHKIFSKQLQNIVDQDEWIIDGNSQRTIENRFKRADVCIHMKLPRWICYYRVYKRIFSKNTSIQDRPDNCPERPSWQLLKYMWTYDERVKDLFPALRKKYPHVRFIEITRDTSAQDILAMIREKAS